MHLSHWRQWSIALSFLGTIVLFTTPVASELSVWMGDFGWDHFISSSVFLIATISWDVMKSAPSSASEAEETTNLRIWEIVRTGTFHRGMASFSERKRELLLCCGLCFFCEILRQNANTEPCFWSDRVFHRQGM